MVAVDPIGKGNLQAFPVGAGTGAGLSVNYNTIDTNLANAGTVKTVTGSGADITVASTLPAHSPAERIHTVENFIPAKGWFNWSKETLVDRMGYYKVPGVSIAVINNDEIEWAKGYGTLKLGSNKSVTPDTLFQSASIGKSLTATATMHFVETGHLSLDENVNNKLVSWKVPENRFTKQKKGNLAKAIEPHSRYVRSWF